MGWDRKEWSFWIAVLVAIAAFSWFRGKQVNRTWLELVPLDREVPK